MLGFIFLYLAMDLLEYFNKVQISPKAKPMSLYQIY
jgi:hypothetical protein